MRPSNGGAYYHLLADQVAGFAAGAWTMPCAKLLAALRTHRHPAGESSRLTGLSCVLSILFAQHLLVVLPAEAVPRGAS
jgi:hypothetical protein